MMAVLVESSWNVMAHGDARKKKWRGNKRMEWVASKRYMTAEHRLARAVQTLQTDVHSSPASSRLNWRPRRFKWTRPFRRKKKSGFCACAITFQTQSSSGTLVHIETNFCTVKVSACRDENPHSSLVQYQSSVECDTASTSHVSRTFS